MTTTVDVLALDELPAQRGRLVCAAGCAIALFRRGGVDRPNTRVHPVLIVDGRICVAIDN
ncbi:MAG: hypothetical protein U1F07_02670 [Rubrivivax sp.]